MAGHLNISLIVCGGWWRVELGKEAGGGGGGGAASALTVTFEEKSKTTEEYSNLDLSNVFLLGTLRPKRLGQAGTCRNSRLTCS